MTEAESNQETGSTGRIEFRTLNSSKPERSLHAAGTPTRDVEFSGRVYNLFEKLSA